MDAEAASTVSTDVYSEARRRLDEACGFFEKALLSKDLPGWYRYKKYVRAGGKAAYEAVELATNELLVRHGIETPREKDVWTYKWRIKAFDERLATDFENAYDMLFLAAGLRSIGVIAMIEYGLELAEEIIERLKD